MSVNIKALESINTNIKIINPNSKLIIVTKNRSINDIQSLINLKYFVFGENKIQEAKKKFLNIEAKDEIQLHLIGSLQSNKVKDALSIFDAIQTIDRKKIVDEIVNIKKKLNLIKTKLFFIQVNIGNEFQKSGVPPEDLVDLYEYCLEKDLMIAGLMCIPPNDKNAKIYFDKMNEIKNKINPELLLSMGMSNDYKDALRAKSNLIRIGSLIFNE